MMVYRTELWILPRWVCRCRGQKNECGQSFGASRSTVILHVPLRVIGAPPLYMRCLEYRVFSDHPQIYVPANPSRPLTLVYHGRRKGVQEP